MVKRFEKRDWNGDPKSVSSTGGVSSYTSFAGASGIAPSDAAYVRIYVEKKSYGFINFDDVTFTNTTSIASQNIALSSGSSTTVTFTWNTSGFAKGNYTITAKVPHLPYETDTTDNTLTDGWVLVTIPGDVNGDRKVDIKDIYACILAFGTKPGKPKWNPNCDINNDLVVDMKDIYTAIRNFGKKW